MPIPDIAETITATGIGGTLIALVGNWIRTKRISIQVNSVHDQVQNDHPKRPNLRDDLDGMEDIMRDIQRRSILHGRDLTMVRSEMSSVREDLNNERNRSIQVDNDLSRKIDTVQRSVGECESWRDSE